MDTLEQLISILPIVVMTVKEYKNAPAKLHFRSSIKSAPSQPLSTAFITIS